MPELHRPAVVVQPAVAPLHQRHECGEQVRALAGEAVCVARPLSRLAIGLALEQALLDELAQPRGGDRLAEAGPFREVGEPGRAVEGLAQDQERRPGADHRQGARDRAALGLPSASRLECSGELNLMWHAVIVAD